MVREINILLDSPCLYEDVSSSTSSNFRSAEKALCGRPRHLVAGGGIAPMYSGYSGLAGSVFNIVLNS